VAVKFTRRGRLLLELSILAGSLLFLPEQGFDVMTAKKL